MNIERNYVAECGLTRATLSLFGPEKVGLSAKYEGKVVFERAGTEKARVTYELVTDVSPTGIFRKLKLSDRGIETLLSPEIQDPGHNWETDREVMVCIIKLQDQVVIPAEI